jgi:hypothetical protein
MTDAYDQGLEGAGVEQALLEELSCPISFQLMIDPVVAENGHTNKPPSRSGLTSAEQVSRQQ